MCITKCFLLFFVILLTVAPNAEANRVTEFDLYPLQGFEKAPEIEVYSIDGEHYTHVDKTDQSRMTAGFRAHCRWGGRANKAYSGWLDVPGYIPTSETDPDGVFIPYSKDATRLFRYDDNTGQSLNPVQVCNDELAKRLTQNPGKSRYDLLAKGFSVNYPAAIRVKYSLICAATGLGKSDLEARETRINARFLCKGSALAAQKSGTDGAGNNSIKMVKLSLPKAFIKFVSFKANPAVQYGSCPTVVRFPGFIEVSGAGKLSYYYLKQDGTRSGTYRMEFSTAGKKNLVHWQTTVSAPEHSSQLAAATGNKQQAFEVDGYYQLVIESGGKKQLFKARYRVDCDPLPQRQPQQIKPIEVVIPEGD